MIAADLDLPEIDPADPELRGARYHAAMAALDGWLARMPLGFIVLDRAAGEQALRTKAAVFPGLKIAELFGIADGPLYEEIVRNIININGDDHRRLRNLINPALTPRAAQRHRPALQGFLEELLDALPADGRCDAVEAICKPYPALAIAHVMGAPAGDAPLLHEWSNWIQRQFDGPSLLSDRPRIEQATAEFYEWADGLLAAKRADPGDDIVSALIAAEEGGDRLSDTELVNLVLNLFVGGVDTAQSQLAHTLRLLAEHPDQWEALRADPDTLAPVAVEEALRYEPITPFTARITVEELTLRDVTFPPDTVLMVSAWHANRDDPGLGAPDRFDLTANRGAARPLTFGAGIHYCVGANLARAELQEAVRLLAGAIERIELDGEPELGTISGIYGVERLPVRLVRA